MKNEEFVDGDEAFIDEACIRPDEGRHPDVSAPRARLRARWKNCIMTYRAKGVYNHQWLLVVVTLFWLLVLGYSILLPTSGYSFLVTHFWLLIQCELLLTYVRALQNGYQVLKRPKMGSPGVLGDPWGSPRTPLGAPLAPPCTPLKC